MFAATIGNDKSGLTPQTDAYDAGACSALGTTERSQGSLHAFRFTEPVLRIKMAHDSLVRVRRY